MDKFRNVNYASISKIIHESNRRQPSLTIKKTLQSQLNVICLFKSLSNQYTDYPGQLRFNRYEVNQLCLWSCSKNARAIWLSIQISKH